MNFNYDLVTWIDYFIGAFFCSVGLLFVGKILFKKSFKDIKIIRLLLLIPITILIILNTLAFNNILKLFGVLLLAIMVQRYILEEKGTKMILFSMITLIIIATSDMLFALFLSLFDYFFHFSVAWAVTNSIFSNSIICVFSIILSILFQKKIMIHIESFDKTHIIIILIQFLLTLFLIISSINFLYIEKWVFSYKFVLIVIIMFVSISLTFTLFRQYLKNKEVVSKYNLLEEYLKTSADLIEKYSSTVHRYKNNLSIIKGYIKTNIPEANKYIDSLLDKMEDKKYSWVKQINRIVIDSIRYLIYYKLSKAEGNNLKICVNVSNDVKNIKSNYLTSNELGHILDIIGEYFDNAIYASSESKEKELNFDLYTLNSQLVFSISNTYSAQINLNMISKNGYTTKGKGHGLGLYDIDKSIKNIKILNNKYEIVNNYFVAILNINLER